MGSCEKPAEISQYDFLRYLVTRYEPNDGPQTQIVGLLRSLFGDQVLTHTMLKSTAISDAGLTKQTLYEVGREQFTRQTYDRALEALDAVNGEVRRRFRPRMGEGAGMKRRDTLRELMKPVTQIGVWVAATRTPHEYRPAKADRPVRPGPLRSIGLHSKRCRPRLTMPGHFAPRSKVGKLLSTRSILIDPSFITDRIPVERDPASTLRRKALRDRVSRYRSRRPHPDTSGRYQAALWPPSAAGSGPSSASVGRSFAHSLTPNS